MRLRERILNGARVLITIVPSGDKDIRLMNRFLSDYGLAYSGIKIRSNEPGGTLTIKYSEDVCRDSMLFRGIKELAVGSATPIDYFYDARPVLFCPENNNLIDQNTDKFITWDDKKLRCIGAYWGDTVNDSLILCFGGSVLAALR